MYNFDATSPEFTVSNNGLTCTKISADSAWDNERILPLLNAGTGVYEVELSIDVCDINITFGIKGESEGNDFMVGFSPLSYGYHFNGKIYHNSVFYGDYGASFTSPQKVTIVFDTDIGTLRFKVDGIDQGIAFTGISGNYYFVWSAYRVTWQVTIQQLPLICMEQLQLITSVITRQHQQLISPASRLYHKATQIIARARRMNLANDQLFDTATPLYIQHEQMFHGMTKVALAFAQVFLGYGPAVALEFIQSWASHDYNLAFLPFVQMIGSQIGMVLQEIQFSVTIAGVRVGVTDCQFDRDDFCQIATLTLADKRDYDNKEQFDNVVITVCGEQFRLIVVDKPYDEQIQQGGVDRGYIIECASITCQLAESINDTVRATRITTSFPAGTMAGEILASITDGICSAALNVTDFPTGGYDFDDAVRIDALRQVFPEGGDYPWIIETDGEGVLQISSWTMPEFGGPGQKTLQFKQKQLTPPEGILYTQVNVMNYNQGDGQTGLTLEVVDNGDGTGTIYGYSVPWTDAFSVFDSEDSSTPSLLITGGSVEEVEVEDTDVEFVDYAASLSKPCYSSPVINWGNNDGLSPITYTESGALTTDTEPGYSVAVKATYTTWRKKWTFDNRKTDVSQVRLRYDD